MKRKYLLNLKECSQFLKEVVLNSIYMCDYDNSFMSRENASIICEGFVEWCNEEEFQMYTRYSVRKLFTYINYMIADDNFIKKLEEDIKLRKDK